MIPITHVKLYHGAILDITIAPGPGHHYEIEDDILWIVSNDKTDVMQLVSGGTIITRGVNEKEVDINMPLDFMYYHMWCNANGFKPHEADTLTTYVGKYDSRGDIRIRNT